ncbi:hypothetical protein RFI_22109 [Reticulomyxa filosa]|uniref:Uncharacterized protein n=1 Tax=Reticulomyxa filosa TaxID=46433 RepID=X6MQ82_RETFI|nr:hypothetical protein RFI_22109 [Reticulomyxa filosa]|eukprot:ETO15255.1 hypothetical protein RFI_22109 [Reticulomyxa filosa]
MTCNREELQQLDDWAKPTVYYRDLQNVLTSVSQWTLSDAVIDEYIEYTDENMEFAAFRLNRNNWNRCYNRTKLKVSFTSGFSDQWKGSSQVLDCYIAVLKDELVVENNVTVLSDVFMLSFFNQVIFSFCVNADAINTKESVVWGIVTHFCN